MSEPSNDAPALSPRVCTDPACTIPRKPGFPMHGPHDFRAASVLPERQRCACGVEVGCLDHCRACNYSGRDLEELCIADPDWEPDDDDLAIREAGLRATAEVRDAE